MPSEAYIGIGSNLDNPKIHCETAVCILDSLYETAVVKCSSFYETEPLGVTDQNWFINAVVKIETSFNAIDLLKALLNIENQMGRIRGEKWGPRKIDLDLLFYDEMVIHKSNLQIPHPEIQNRIFVLVPLCEINPKAFHPVLEKTASQLLDALPKLMPVRRLVNST